MLLPVSDRAFEVGLFTLTVEGRVSVNGIKLAESPWARKNIAPLDGESIALGPIKPAPKSLRQHWDRIGFSPEGLNA